MCARAGDRRLSGENCLCAYPPWGEPVEPHAPPLPHSADGSEAEFSGDGALNVTATASVAWVPSAANHEGMVGYSHPTIRDRGGGRMASAAQCRTVPHVLARGGWRGRCGAPSHCTYGRRDGTELAETDLRVFRPRNAQDCRSFLGRGLVALRGVRGLSFAREAGTARRS